MKNFNLNINGIVVVKREEMIYKASVQDMEKEFFSINIPVNNNEFLILNTGEIIYMEYYNGDESYYGFEAKVLGREKCENIPAYKLSLPFNIIKIQRRDFVRVKTLKQVQYKKVHDELWNEATLLDLSGGGIRFKSKEIFNVNEKLHIKIEIKGYEFEVLAEIKRCEKASEHEYNYGLEFIDIDEYERDKIIEEVFLVMRKQRQII